MHVVGAVSYTHLRGGINKTTFFYYILPPCLRQYFINESTANYTDKDFMEAFSSKALICLDELESTFGLSLIHI